MGHDAAHGDRVLRFVDERYQFPGGHPAAAVLRQRDGRWGELRRHRHGGRPRTDARFRRRGRQFDAKGNLRDWWTPEDANEFEQRAACIEREYSKFEVAPGAIVNGKLTLGENTADNGGVRIALMEIGRA